MATPLIKLESIAKGFRYVLAPDWNKPQTGPHSASTPRGGAVVLTRSYDGEKWMPDTWVHRGPRHYKLVCDWFIAPEYHQATYSGTVSRPCDTLQFTRQLRTPYFMARACSPWSAGDTAIDLGLVHEADLIEIFLTLEIPPHV